MEVSRIVFSKQHLTCKVITNNHDYDLIELYSIQLIAFSFYSIVIGLLRVARL